MTSDIQHRYYFALWPDDELRAKLRKIAGDVVARGGGELLPPDQLHITLAHLGELRAGRLADVRKAAAEVAFERVEIEFTRIEYWPEVKLASLVCDRRPEVLLGFVRALHATLKKLNVQHYDFDYHPHVSIAHEVQHNVSSVLSRPLYWRADHFVLAEAHPTEGGVEHRVVDAWEGGWTREGV